MILLCCCVRVRCNLKHTPYTNCSRPLPASLPHSVHEPDTFDTVGTNHSSYSDAPEPIPADASFWSLNYYRHFFEVNTAQIGLRLLRAIVPIGQHFYSDDDPKPDLYGPFWIATTLILFMSATGNFSSYYDIDPKDRATWSYDFKKVTAGATAFYGYISIVPLLVWFAMKHCDDNKSFVNVASLFGYALISYVPVCLLCIPPLSMLRWLSIATAFVISSYFLVKNLWTDFHNKKLFPVMVAVLLVNLGIAIATKFYFFSF